MKLPKNIILPKQTFEFYDSSNTGYNLLQYISDTLYPGKIKYNTYCQTYPEKQKEFENLLRIYQEDYEQVNKIIEGNIKNGKI